MSRSTSSFSNPARRRRMIVLRCTARTALAAAVDDDASPDEVWSDLPLSHSPPLATEIGSVAVDVGPPVGPAHKLSTEPPASPLPTSLREVMRDTRPLTWLITGDSHEPPRGAREWRNFSGRLIEHLRLHLQRTEDAFVVTSSPGKRIDTLSGDVPMQLLRFQPDIVLLSVSPGEVEAGRRGLAAFEDQLLRIVQAGRSAGFMLCLATPPVTPLQPGVDPIDVLIYVEAVRSVAAEYDLPLIDHYAYWEEAAMQIGGLERWFDQESRWPGRIGHEQLCRRIISDLGLALPTPS